MADNDEICEDATEDFERLAANSAEAATYILRLYVSGMTPRSTEAITNLTTICEQHLKNRYELDVVDIYKHPEAAADDQIIATPTLVKKLPLPLRTLVGTLSDEERVLVGLNIIRKK